MSWLKLFGSLLIACWWLLAPAQAQTWPSRPIRFVVPYPPGGLPDVVARLVGQQLGESLGQPVVIDNKPGALGRVAAGTLAAAPADGYTFLVSDSAMLTVAPLLSRAAVADGKEIDPVVMMGSAPLYMVVNPQVAARNFDEFVAYARTRPQGVSYGSSGNGTVHHLAAEALRSALQIPMTHIPFKGSAPSVAALIGGQIDMVLTAYPNAASFLKSGQARILGVTSAARSALTPNVPSLAEKVPGFDFSVMVAVFARPGTPDEATARITAEVARIVRRADIHEQLNNVGMMPTGWGRAELTRTLKEESARMADAFKAANLQPE